MKKIIYGLTLVLSSSLVSARTTELPSDFSHGERTDVLASDKIAETTVMVMAGSEGCTGSLIDTDIVITAAHCIKASVNEIKIIFTTDITLYEPGKVRKGLAVKVHPEYQSTKDNEIGRHDIALIRFKGDLPSEYHPAELLSDLESDTLKEGQTSIIAGYGGNSWGFLSKIELPFAKRLGESEILLAQPNGQGARHGDSGGPAFASNGKLWGVCSRGFTEYSADKTSVPYPYSVYTQIRSYASWINSAQTELKSITY
jgi:secreted trypsin-like serine protease